MIEELKAVVTRLKERFESIKIEPDARKTEALIGDLIAALEHLHAIVQSIATAQLPPKTEAATPAPEGAPVQ